MGLFQENTSLIYLSILIIPVLSIVVARKHVSVIESIAPTMSTRFTIFSVLSLFCGTAFSTLLVLLPFINNFSLPILFVPLCIAALISLSRYNKIFSLAAVSFVEKISPFTQIASLVVFIFFFVLIHITAVIFLGAALVEDFFNTSVYLFVVLNIAVAGFVVLIGDRMTMLVNNAILGFLSVVTIAFLWAFSDASELLGSIVMRTIQEEGEIFFAGSSHTLSFVYVPIGVILLVVLVWWIDWYMTLHTGSDETDNAMNNITTFFLLLTISMLLIVLGLTLNKKDVSVNMSEFPLFMLQVLPLVAFLFLGALFYSFSVVKSFAMQISRQLSVEKRIREKDILAGRLVVAAIAILNILLFPVIKMVGVKIIVLNFVAIACFMTPLISVFSIFIVWKALNRLGITAGIAGGIVVGVIMFVLSIPGVTSGAKTGIDPSLMAVTSFTLTALFAFVGTVFSKKKEALEK